MPTHLPNKRRAKTIRAFERAGLDKNDEVRIRIGKAHKRHARDGKHPIDNVDWLALWALSLAFSAVFIAALVYFGEGDASGASAVLVGTAGIIAVVLYSGKAPDNRP